jgi:putative acetyltransferase
MTAARVRPAQDGERAAILAIHRAGFGRDAEAALCARLMDEGVLVFSLAAEEDAVAVGHVALSPVALAEDPAAPRMLGLGPIAVEPARQRKGIGSVLMRAALEAARREGWAGVVLLGDPDYYGRFGFVPAATFGLGCAWDVPSQYFMAVELTPGALEAARGKVLFHPAFEPD